MLSGALTSAISCTVTARRDGGPRNVERSLAQDSAREPARGSRVDLEARRCIADSTSPGNTATQTPRAQSEKSFHAELYAEIPPPRHSSLTLRVVADRLARMERDHECLRSDGPGELHTCALCVQLRRLEEEIREMLDG